jgi:DNA-binding transcriptional MocR family regulator
MPREMLRVEYEASLTRHHANKVLNLSLDIARGKPHADQLAFSHGLLTCLSPGDIYAEDGTDCLNYGGGVSGLPEMKRLFAQILDVSPGDVIVGGNSSLNIMFDCIAALLTEDTNWQAARAGGSVKFICPSPGYDRHFSLCEYLNIEMLPIPMTNAGPDMDAVEALASSDPTVAGMWCVPVFSNPQGYVYTDETITRLAAMPAANPGFRLFWDNAYAVHYFRGERPNPRGIRRECEKYHHTDRPICFTSFSKISFAGAAVACLAASETNRGVILKRLAAQTVGPDKLNQLRHIRFFKDLPGVLAHMEKLATVLRPKFERADAVLTRELAGTGAGEWDNPSGGYFISFYTNEGCAKRTVQLCREAGVILTPAGAPFPYGRDPEDKNIRIAPTFPPIGELIAATELLCVCAQMAAQGM